jgi:hypothetical protein
MGLKLAKYIYRSSVDDRGSLMIAKPSALRSSRTLLRDNLPFAVLLILGVAVRLCVMIFYSSVVLIYYGGDSTRYLRLPFTGYRSLFSDPNTPAGYPAFLDVTRWVTRDIVFTIGVQHLVGIATAAVVFVCLRHMGLSAWFASIPAGVLFLSGDVIFLETSLLVETLWTLFMIAGLCLAAYAPRARRTLVCLGGTGILLGLATLVRSVALPLAVLIAVWVIAEIKGTRPRRLLAAVTVLVGTALVVGAYVLTVDLNGGYAGISEMGGFNLYARVGQFADCQKFRPPPGTAKLCESTPSVQRSGPFYYTYAPTSPFYRAGLGADPHGSEVVGRFAEAAILHQPVEYLHAVATDLLRYLAPYAVVARADSGVAPNGMSFASSTPANQGQTPAVLRKQYSEDFTGVSKTLPSGGVRELLGAYQEVFRLGGITVMALIIISIVGLCVSSGSRRRATLLFFVTAAYLYVLPVAVSSYDVRYGVPAGVVLSVAGALAAASIWEKARDRVLTTHDVAQPA